MSPEPKADRASREAVILQALAAFARVAADHLAHGLPGPVGVRIDPPPAEAPQRGYAWRVIAAGIVVEASVSTLVGRRAS